MGWEWMGGDCTLMSCDQIMGDNIRKDRCIHIHIISMIHALTHTILVHVS